MPTEKQIISQAMSILGSRTSKKKAAASKRNGIFGGKKGNAHARRKASREHLAKLRKAELQLKKNRSDK